MKAFFKQHYGSMIAAAIAAGCAFWAFKISHLACYLVVGAAAGVWASVKLFKGEAPPK